MDQEAISVIVRIRPSSDHRQPKCLTKMSNQIVRFDDGSNQCHEFSFDTIFDSNTSNASLFESLKYVITIDSNASIICYGQTAAGKSHTVEGVLPLISELLYNSISPTTTISVSVLEIYNERLTDLINIKNTSMMTIVSDKGSRGVHVPDATLLSVHTHRECLDEINKALSHRAIGSTSMNAISSRSHCLVTFTMKEKLSDGTFNHRKVSVVDLAGSERQAKSLTEGMSLTEGNNINKSLSCLSNVVHALSAKSLHVPYRDSKLTRLLQDSLGGSALTILLLCVSPTVDNSQETLSTLRFGVRAKGVLNSVNSSKKSRPLHVLQMKTPLHNTSWYPWALTAILQTLGLAFYFCFMEQCN